MLQPGAQNQNASGFVASIAVLSKFPPPTSWAVKFALDAVVCSNGVGAIDEVDSAVASADSDFVAESEPHPKIARIKIGAKNCLLSFNDLFTLVRVTDQR